MPSFTLTKKAVDDLMEIGRYTQKNWGKQQRTKYLRMLDASFQTLSHNPQAGDDCANLREGYRKLRVGSHIIFYRQMSKSIIQIVRILHARMDFDTHLTN